MITVERVSELLGVTAPAATPETAVDAPVGAPAGDLSFQLPAAVWEAIRAPLPVHDDGTPDRSGGVYRLVAACRESGLDIAQTLAAVRGYAPAREKFGTARNVLAEQVIVCWSRIESSGPEPSSWRAVDLRPYLDGSRPVVEPSLGVPRSDGLRLLYPGKEHAVIGEMESGKSWWLIACTAAELIAGHRVVYVHFEEVDPADTVDRLRALGVPDAAILERLCFVGPDAPVTTAALAALLDPPPSLVVFDGVNEAMSLHRWGVLEVDGAALFRRELVKPCTRVGAATLAADHVAKDPERRGRTALGTVHKVNGLSGSLVLLENAEPFGRGRRGRSRVYTIKDRPGYLRRHGQPTPVPGRTYMGELVVDDTRDRLSYLDLQVFAPSPQPDDQPEPEPLAERVRAVIAAQPDGRIDSERKLFAAMRAAGCVARNAAIREAVDDLLATARLVEHPGPRNSRGYRAVPTASHDQEETESPRPL